MTHGLHPHFPPSVYTVDIGVRIRPSPSVYTVDIGAIQIDQVFPLCFYKQSTSGLISPYQF